jgi:hypothetical protein
VPLHLSQLLWWLTACFLCAMNVQVQAQTAAQSKSKAVVPGPPPDSGNGNGPCLIADFRLMALTTHDPQERQKKAIDWLQKNNANCSPVQLSILHSSKAVLLGTADSMAVSATFDAIMEKRLAKNPEALAKYYRPDVQTPSKSKAEAASVAPDAGASKPAAGGAATPALAAGATVQPLVMPGAAGSGSAASQNISINMGGAKPPEEDMSRKMPLPTEPLFAFPPELGTPLLNYFGKIRRQFARTFFMETLSPGKCPEGMTWRNDKCEASFKAEWRFGEKVPQGIKTYPVEPKLVEKLNFDPGYTFVRVGGDILALERDTGKIADAILNLGKAS